MRIRTANRRRRRAHARRVYEEAFRYHLERCARLQAGGRLDRLRDSGFVRRRCKPRMSGRLVRAIEEAPRQAVIRTVRPDDLGDGGPMHHMFLRTGVPDNY